MLVDREWYSKHKNDFSREDIDSLGIEVSVGGKRLGEIRQRDKKGKLKAVLETQDYKEGNAR